MGARNIPLTDSPHLLKPEVGNLATPPRCQHFLQHVPGHVAGALEEERRQQNEKERMGLKPTGLP